MTEINSQQRAPFSDEEVMPPKQEDGPQIQPKKKSNRSILGGSAVGGRKLGMIAVIGVIGLALMFVLIHSAPKKRPAAKTSPQQQQQEQQKSQQTTSLPSDRAQNQQQGLNPGGDDMTPEKIQKSTQPGVRQQGIPAGETGGNNGVPNNNGNLGQVPAFSPPQVPGTGQWTPPAYGNSPNAAAVKVIATSRREALTKSSMTYVVQPSSQAHLAGQVAGATQETQETTNNLGYQPGYHLSAHLETVASTAVSAPVIAVVDFDYQRNGMTIVPAGARLIGSIGASSATGIVNLHFNSIRMPNGNTLSVSAIGLNHQMMPLKGIVTGRHVVQQILMASLGGLGSVAAVYAGGNVNGQLTEADMMRSQAASRMGSNIDNQVSNLQQSVSQSLVVTMPAGSQVEVMFTSAEAKPTVNASAVTEK